MGLVSALRTPERPWVREENSHSANPKEDSEVRVTSGHSATSRWVVGGWAELCYVQARNRCARQGQRERKHEPDSGEPPSPLFSQVLILKGVKVLCFHTLLQVLILNVVIQGPMRCRLEASFSNLKAAMAIHFCWYNFCRVHQTLRVTPAMQTGIADRVWPIEELLGAVS